MLKSSLGGPSDFGLFLVCYLGRSGQQASLTVQSLPILEEHLHAGGSLRVLLLILLLLFLVESSLLLFKVRDDFL